MNESRHLCSSHSEDSFKCPENNTWNNFFSRTFQKYLNEVVIVGMVGVAGGAVSIGVDYAVSVARVGAPRVGVRVVGGVSAGVVCVGVAAAFS